MIPDKYSKRDIVQHRKGGLYRIIMTPSEGVHIEMTGEPAYLYKSLQDGKWWARGKAEMEEEDRFWKYEDADIATQKGA